MAGKSYKGGDSMHVLITGVAGFVGSTVARRLIADGYKITGIDDFSAGYEKRLEDFRTKFDFKQGKVESILPDLTQKCDVIINCAATAPLPANEIDHFSSIQNNVATCGSVMQYAARMNVKRVIHFSSSAVYEGIPNSEQNRLNEEMELSTKLVYPTSKLLSEIYMKTQANVHDIQTYSLRLFNLYGPHQDYFRQQPPLLGYLFKCMIKNETATLFGKAGNKRDYVYIDDLISLIKELMTKSSEKNIYEELNVGSGSSFDVFEIVENIQKITGRKLQIKKQNPKYFWDSFQESKNQKIILPQKLLEDEVNKVAFCDLTKSKRFGFNPKVDICQGLRECYETAREYLN